MARAGPISFLLLLQCWNLGPVIKHIYKIWQTWDVFPGGCSWTHAPHQLVFPAERIWKLSDHTSSVPEAVSQNTAETGILGQLLTMQPLL